MAAIARFARLLPLIATAALAAYGLLSSAGSSGALLLAVIVGLGGVLAFRAWHADAVSRAMVRRTADAGLLCVPAALVMFLSFSSGGFFADSTAIAALAMAVLLVIRLALADQPLVALGPAALVSLVGLAGLAGWALLSQLWSGAPGRSTVGFDRDLLYLLTFTLFASVGRSRMRLAWALRGVALAMSAVAAVALLSRVAPDILATTPVPESNGRLAYPLTYWNALGLLCAIGGVLCVHLAAADERRVIRVLAAGAVPILGTTLLLTYSRGGLVAAAIALLAYALLGRPRGLPGTLLAAGPATAIAVKAAYDDTLLSSPNPTTAAAVHQGHHLALLVVACVAGAVVLRVALLPLDRRLERGGALLAGRTRARRRLSLTGAAIAVVAALALGAPTAIAHRFNQFVDQQTVTAGPLVRNRLSSTSNNGRLELWTIAWDVFLAHPLEGTGQETFEVLWYEHRKEGTVVVNAHSLYLETLSELGVVGLLFVAAFVIGTLVGLAPFRRGRDRALYAALFATTLAWAVHAGVDWDWQMPAVSLWVAALGGLALGRPDWRGMRRAGSRTLVAALCLGLVVVASAALPALVLGSQVRLDDATDAYAAGHCATADADARRSIEILDSRAAPWQIEALCSVASGHYRRAQAQFRSGLAADPDDWQLESGLAASIVASGGDAHPELVAAERLDPLDTGLDSVAAAAAHGPSRAARRAARAFLSQQSLIESG